ncbi:MAG TPA: hypothetical protein VIG33_14615 [Pseudobdellovibrionaceae bacterium]|jgi:hypothetical protein
MKNFSLIAFSLILNFVSVACQTIDRTTPVIRREVKDQSFAGKSDNGQPRKRLMVLPFIDSSAQHPEYLRDKARATFLKELNKSGEVVAVDSRDMKSEVLKPEEKGEYDLKEIAKQAQGQGFNAVLEGKIIDVRVARKADKVGLVRQMKSEFEAVVRVRVVSTRNGQEVFNTVKTVNLEEPTVRVVERVETDKFLQNNPELIESIIRDAFLDFVPQVLASFGKVSWEGRIAALNGDRIYLNVGRTSGIQVGDLLKVLEQGDDVYDPESGGHIGTVPGRLKGTLEVISYFGNDGSIAVIHSGSGFKENDRVELY